MVIYITNYMVLMAFLMVPTWILKKPCSEPLEPTYETRLVDHYQDLLSAQWFIHAFIEVAKDQTCQIKQLIREFHVLRPVVNDSF